jgi:glycerol-3-phosphate dehydrogenase
MQWEPALRTELEYGDNFLSVYISNSANEMVRFLREVKHEESTATLNYAASVYLGDLLVRATLYTAVIECWAI